MPVALQLSRTAASTKDPDPAQPSKTFSSQVHGYIKCATQKRRPKCKPQKVIQLELVDIRGATNGDVREFGDRLFSMAWKVGFRFGGKINSFALAEFEMCRITRSGNSFSKEKVQDHQIRQNPLSLYF